MVGKPKAASAAAGEAGAANAGVTAAAVRISKRATTPSRPNARGAARRASGGKGRESDEAARVVGMPKPGSAAARRVGAAAAGVMTAAATKQKCAIVPQ